MTPGGMDRSTRGGRTIARTAVAVQAASLSSLPLVRPRSLQLLPRPLGPLRASVELGILEAALAALTSVTGDGRAPAGRSSVGGAAPATGLRAPAPSAVAHTAAPVRGQEPDAGATAGRAARDVAEPRPAASAPQQTHWRAVSASAVRDAIGTPPAQPPTEPHDPVVEKGRPPVPESLPALSTADLMHVARGDTSVHRVEVGPTTGALPTDESGADGAEAPVASRRAAPLTAAATPLTVAVQAEAGSPGEIGFPTIVDASLSGQHGAGGALAELVGRWHRASAAEPAGPNPGLDPLPPFAAAAPPSFAFPAAQPDLDGLEVTLSELLRRDLERHGLGAEVQ